MDINKNIVKIKLSTQIGTGILYQCETNEKYSYNPLYIIFTNRHLVTELIDVPREKNLILMVDFEIYDNNCSLIDKDAISQIKLFCEKPGDKSTSVDIAAFLIEFNYNVNIDIETKLIWRDFELNNIYIEGFPRVLYDNEVSSKLQLQGKYKKVFPESRSIGIFQITDDYHWYSNYNDLKLFKGFSGGPVYSIDNSGCYLVGLNQSILNISEGENPFKLLYYYKIIYVLEYLREQGCIIFKYNLDRSASIRWIYDEK